MKAAKTKPRAAKPKTPPDPGDRVVAFVRRLQTDAGPFVLEPWAERWLRELFGTVDAAGRRRYSTAFLSIARRNGKTFLVAAVVLYLLLTERNCRGLVAAAAAEQAAELYRYAKRMAELTPGLGELLRCGDYHRVITCERTGVEFRVVASDAATQHGKGARFVILDEVHALKSGGHALYDALSTSQGAEAPGRLFVGITTAARAGDEATAAGTLYALARRVLADPELDPSFHATIFEAPADCAIDDESAWLAANPSLGRIRQVDELREKCNRAKLSPGWEPSFRQLYLNQWFTGGLTAANWLKDLWPRGAKPVPDVEGLGCYCGVDVATKYDYCAAVLLFPLDGGAFAVLPHYWLPEGVVAEKQAREKTPIAKWERDGALTLTPGNILDLELVLDGLLDLHRRYDVKSWAFDPWHDAYLIGALQARGVRSTVELGQTVKNLSAACKELEALLRDGRLYHGSHPVLTHQAQACAVYRDRSGNMKPDRDKSPVSIDGIPAMLCALARYMLDAAPPPPAARSVYEDRGLFYA